MINAKALRPQDVANARIFADRNDMIRSFAPRRVVVEVGVLTGNFTAIMLDAFKPECFIAIDNWDMFCDVALRKRQ